MSVKLEIYNDIVSALGTITELKTIGLYNSQFDREEDEWVRDYPKGFIEFATIPWLPPKQTTGKGTSSGNTVKQQDSGEVIITIHIGFSYLQDADVSFPLLDVIVQKVYLALQGLSGSYYGPLKRVEERQDPDHDRVLDWQMDFSTMLQECGEADSGLVDANDPIGTITDITINKDLDIDNPIIRTGDGV